MTDPIQSNEERTMSNIFESWRAGFVRRWHTNPDLAQYHDEIAAHQGRCVVLAIQLFPDASVDLLKAIAMHDLAERWVGDLPYTFREDGATTAEIEHGRAEDEVAINRGFYVELEDLDLDRLNLVDRLDAFLFMMKNAPGAVDYDDWMKTRDYILSLSEILSVQKEVVDILDWKWGGYIA